MPSLKLSIVTTGIAISLVFGTLWCNSDSQSKSIVSASEKQSSLTEAARRMMSVLIPEKEPVKKPNHTYLKVSPWNKTKK